MHLKNLIKKLTTGIFLSVSVLCLSSCQTNKKLTIVENPISELNAIHAIGQACHKYAFENNYMLPQKMSDIKPYLNDLETDGFELIPHGNITKMKNIEDTILIRSKTITSDGKRAVTFVNGSSCFIEIKS